jgi:hypothetical protein
MSPVSRQPVTAPENFPKQIQFRYNGVDLGGPDATVLDFVGTGFVASRAGDTVTVTLT